VEASISGFLELLPEQELVQQHLMAVVRRQFPNRLSVVLQEHQAVAYWGAERESLLINSYGEVFEANSSRPIVLRSTPPVPFLRLAA